MMLDVIEIGGVDAHARRSVIRISSYDLTAMVATAKGLFGRL
jgi:hypothetical protein